MQSGTHARRGLALLCTLLTVGAAEAQTTDIKIGVVNMSQLIEQAPQSQAVMAELRDEFAPRQRDLTAMQTALTTKQETYQRDASVMGAAERANLEREIRDGTRDLQRADNELREDFNIRQNEELTNLQRTIVQQVQTYARDAGFDLVIYEAVYASEAVDITAAVLASFQAAAPNTTGQ
jgi:outer membrane protein